MTPCKELELVRHQLESLEFSRLTASTPDLDAHHQALCRREVVLLSTGPLTRSERFLKLPR
jgi:hypothetical protein